MFQVKFLYSKKCNILCFYYIGKKINFFMRIVISLQRFKTEVTVGMMKLAEPRLPQSIYYLYVGSSRYDEASRTQTPVSSQLRRYFQYSLLSPGSGIQYSEKLSSTLSLSHSLFLLLLMLQSSIFINQSKALVKSSIIKVIYQ